MSFAGLFLFVMGGDDLESPRFPSSITDYPHHRRPLNLSLSTHWCQHSAHLKTGKQEESEAETFTCAIRFKKGGCFSIFGFWKGVW